VNILARFLPLNIEIVKVIPCFYTIHCINCLWKDSVEHAYRPRHKYTQPANDWHDSSRCGRSL
jgi:hypothetical protein